LRQGSNTRTLAGFHIMSTAEQKLMLIACRQVMAVGGLELNNSHL
jgi:hypothetical protein